ncbi:DinB family protein [Sphingobacterium hungaricum]|uniref:DinB family protein n=1 Tax=Sphingobacterium hungaricum TaxID=2082723 RepID=A0A928UX92_9SPHI|nr:DinB family protein [Sphingobacterium hungaricum]MBE8714976.1 DinB family protein [Sphingobacterium hungaricum]
MIENTINRLKFLLATIPTKLQEIDENIFSERSMPNKWSKKEILGHLIDSATNNHQRFIRCQFEENPLISYDQEKWVQTSNYQAADKRQLIDFWTAYNSHLVHIMTAIPQEKLTNSCKMIDGSTHTLAFLINDYVDHLEHHLKQLVNY